MKLYMYTMLLILYLIYYILFSIIFDTYNIFGYFLHILLIYIIIYVLYVIYKEKNKTYRCITIGIISIFFIYIIQYNYLKIPEYPENFILQKPNIVNVNLKDCRVKECTNKEIEDIIKYFLEGNIAFSAPNGLDDLINSPENKQILENITFNKIVIFKKFLYNIIYNEQHTSQKKGIDIVFNESEFQEYKKAYAYYIYEKIINNNKNTQVLDSFHSMNNNFFTLLYNKKNYYNSSLYSEKLMISIWNKLGKIEKKVNNAKR